jgi:lipopolysaccharide/colanic/teichoic acid biosynthesis glycosyltransferase
MLKRFIDIVLSLMGLILAFPIMLMVALAIRLETPGSVFFSQTRLGLKGKKFQVHKFRKFPVDWGTFGTNVTLASDVRRTAVGSFIERTKLDELPQLWNILKGEMSCVGPRPELLVYADLFEGEYKELLNYKPGIFGPNQVEFRNEAELYPPDQDVDEFYRNVLFPKKAKKDIEYFSNSNCISELICIVQGIWVSLAGVVNWQNLISLYGKIVLVDILAMEFSWVVTNLLRFGFSIKGHNLEGLLSGMLLFPVITFSAMIFAGVYRTPARYFSGNDASRMIFVVSLAWMITAFFILGFVRRDISVVLPPVSLLIVLSIISIIRIWHREKKLRFIQSSHSGNKIKIVVYGVGYRGITMANLVEQGFPGAQLVGLIDDRVKMRGRYISKYKVLGCERDLDTLHKIYEFEQLWMSFSPSEESLSRLTGWCQLKNVKLVILPDIEPFSTLRESSLSDRSNDFLKPQYLFEKITIQDRRRIEEANEPEYPSQNIVIQNRRMKNITSNSGYSSQKITIPGRRRQDKIKLASN